MISIAFKADYLPTNLTHVSMISEQDSCVYGLFEHFLLVESGRISPDEIDAFLQPYAHLSTHFASKSKSFTHTDEMGMQAMKSTTQYQEFFDINPQIYCCFNDDILPLSQRQVKHFSTIVNDHFKYKPQVIAYVHFGKNNFILTITGLDGFKFYNQYEMETATDVLYFLKAVFQNTNIDENEVRLVVGGYIEEQSVIYKTIYQYFNHVAKAEGQHFAAKNETISTHSYFDHYLNILR